MPRYRRAIRPGGTFFFTLVTEDRAHILTTDLARPILHRAIADCVARRPFTLDSIVLLPDHLHLMMTLPKEETDYSVRISSIKASFTHEYLQAGGEERPRFPSRERKRRRGVWQRWYWEHEIRDQDDFRIHMDYISYNPVKHGHAKCPHAWAYSSFTSLVAKRLYEKEWQCRCGKREWQPPDFSSLPLEEME